MVLAQSIDIAVIPYLPSLQLNNLRVIDSSIMPDIVSGNLNAATLMIAEKASSIILNNEEEVLDVDYYK